MAVALVQYLDISFRISYLLSSIELLHARAQVAMVAVRVPQVLRLATLWQGAEIV